MGEVSQGGERRRDRAVFDERDVGPAEGRPELCLCQALPQAPVLDLSTQGAEIDIPAGLFSNT
jgi:hypothetical protein